MTTPPRPERTFDRVPRWDPNNADYPIRELIGTVPQPRVRRVWGAPIPILDQGREGACVPHSHLHEALASPVRVDLSRTGIAALGFPTDPQALAFALYAWCKRNDEWEGEHYSGTSVLAGAKGMMMLGLYREYRWGFSRNDLVDALIAHGPAVLGMNWHESMYEAPGGEVVVSGAVVGGHAILATGYDPARRFSDGSVHEAVQLTNSWSEDWGVGGQAWIPLDQLWNDLLARGGDICIPVRRSYGRPRRRLPAVLRRLCFWRRKGQQQEPE